MLQCPDLAARRDVRLAPPPGPRRRPVPPVGQAGHHGAGPPGRRVGVLRLDRGPVHGVPARGVARAPRHGGPGPARTAAVHRAGRRRRRRRRRGAGPSGATCPTSPASATGATRRPRPGLARHGVHRRRPGPPGPRTATSTSRAGATTSSSVGASTCTRPKSRTCWPRSTASPRWRSSGCPTSSGDSGSAWPTSPPAGAGADRGRPAGRGLGPPRALQAAQGLHPGRRPAPHGHREAHTTGRPGTWASRRWTVSG